MEWAPPLRSGINALELLIILVPAGSWTAREWAMEEIPFRCVACSVFPSRLLPVCA